MKPREAFASLRTRLTLVLLVVALLGASNMTFQELRHRDSAEDVLEDHTIATQARALREAMRFAPSGALASITPPSHWRRAYEQAGAAYFTVFAPGGTPVAWSRNLKHPLPFAPPRGEPWWRAVQISPDAGDLSLSVAAPNGYVLRVDRSQPGALAETERTFLGDFQGVGYFALILIVAAAAVWRMADWSLRPFVSASEEAALITADDPRRRFDIAALPSEARPFAKSVNDALARIAEAYDAEKRFTADAAHALRTPVAVMDLRVQRAMATSSVDLAALKSDLEAIARSVSGLLNLARAETVDARTSQTNLSRLVREQAAALEPLLQARGRSILVEADENAHAGGDPRTFRDAVDALLENAIVHGRGLVTARVALSPDRRFVNIDVSDEGPGVPEADRDRVFERFAKGNAVSAGAGLGLAVVRQVARAQGGAAAFVGPAKVRLSVPAARGPAL